MKTREQVDLNQIDANPWQPRRAMAPDALDELADNIAELGLLQVPMARLVQDGRFQLAFGHRRVAACRLLREQVKWPDSIPVDVEDLTDERMAVIALSENVQRRELTAIEVVRAHKRAVEETDLSVQTLADQIGVARPTLSNNLRVLELPDFVLEHVESGAMSMTSAREFLVLQHAGHAHLEDMRAVVRRIASVFGDDGSPDWTRRHVRQRIYERVAYNEQDWRPLGPMPAEATGGAYREATFDVDAFVRDYPESVHTIPAVSKSELVNYRSRVTCEGSRDWTCEVKEWSRRQSRATREANKEVQTDGGTPDRPARKIDSDRDSQLGELLAKDPVWKKIAAAREKKGPHRPVTEEERQQLGTRAEYKTLGHSASFWKLLQSAAADDHVRDWNRLDGGRLPPYFPDLDECRKCTIGAAYSRSEYGDYPLQKPTLVCHNKAHYLEKLEAGKAEYRVQLEAAKKDVFRQDRELTQRFTRELAPLSEDTLRALAASIIAGTERFELLHPFGSYHEDWSYEAGATAKVRDLLGMELRSSYYGAYLGNPGVAGLDGVGPSDIRELVASLTVHHLRAADRMDTVSQETQEPGTHDKGCGSCGHTRIVKDASGREVAGGAHQANTGLCWFCWKKTPEGEESMARLQTSLTR